MTTQEPTITKLTFSQLCDFANRYWEQHPEEATQFNPSAPSAVIVFTQDSFNKEYSETSRSYQVSLANKYFLPNQAGNSLFGNCLDGSEDMVRLDYYLTSWKIDYCYIKH